MPAKLIKIIIDTNLWVSYLMSQGQSPLGQLLLSESVIDSVRKMIKKIAPDVKTNNEDLQKILLH